MAAKKKRSMKKARKGSSKIGKASRACKGMGKMKRKACMKSYMSK
jgi:hypothetical protein